MSYGRVGCGVFHISDCKPFLTPCQATLHITLCDRTPITFEGGNLVAGLDATAHSLSTHLFKRGIVTPTAAVNVLDMFGWQVADSTITTLNI